MTHGFHPLATSSIHKYNVDATMECILPFHETSAFARMIKILDIESVPAQRCATLRIRPRVR